MKRIGMIAVLAGLLPFSAGLAQEVSEQSRTRVREARSEVLGSWPVKKWCSNSEKNYRAPPDWKQQLEFSEVLSGPKWKLVKNDRKLLLVQPCCGWTNLLVFPFCHNQKRAGFRATLEAKRFPIPDGSNEREWPTGLFFITDIEEKASSYLVSGYFFERRVFYNTTTGVETLGVSLNLYAKLDIKTGAYQNFQQLCSHNPNFDDYNYAQTVILRADVERSLNKIEVRAGGLIDFSSASCSINAKLDRDIIAIGIFGKNNPVDNNDQITVELFSAVAD